MDTEKNPLGMAAIQSPKDYRYINLVHVAGATPAPETFPASFHIDYTDVPDLFQRGIGACTCHSPAEIAMHRVQRQGGALKHFSPRFLYAMSKITDGLPVADGDCGTYCVQPFKMANKYGIATEDTCPNDTTLTFLEYVYNRDITTMGDAIFADADANRIFPGYVQVGQTGNVQVADIQQALMTGLDGIALTLPIGAEWWTSESGKVSWASADILPIRKVVTQVSGHCIAITGWDTEATTNRIKIYFRNHWSTAWADGDNGWFYADQHLDIVEAWMPSDIPDALLAIVKSLPARADFKPTFPESIAPGTNSPDVTNLQIALKIIGTFPFNQPVTSYFGPITVAAVKAFQTQYQVATPEQIAAAAGNVGPKTIVALNTLLAQK